ncbi:MAG TPA: transcription-repair coupling factor, partial [Chromatiales bacterium]|nr:transcription-repair coupling factor [Chromatiales bacterium]
MSEIDPFRPALPRNCAEECHWGRIHGSALGLILGNAARRHDGLIVVVTPDMRKSEELAHELRFYLGDAAKQALLTLPDRETLPYDVFSPHQDIISERLYTLQKLPAQRQGILIVPVDTLIVRLPPREYLEAHSLVISRGDHLDPGAFRERLDKSGYRCVSQVMEHGEYTVRGSLIDLFPMGSAHPYRIDLFDDEVDSIRIFQPEDQRSKARIDHIRLLPANEFPLDEEAVSRFRQGWRSRFPGDPQRSPVYREVSNQSAPPGIEYYLPLFFTHTHTLFDYLPRNSVVLFERDMEAVCAERWTQINERYEQGRHDMERPLLPPEEVFLPPDEALAQVRVLPHCDLQPFALEERPGHYNFRTHAPPALSGAAAGGGQMAALRRFLGEFPGRVLLVAETTGRREIMLEMLHDADFYPTPFPSWEAFLDSDARLGITVALLDRGLLIDEPPIAVISESQLHGEQVMQRRRRKGKARDSEA